MATATQRTTFRTRVKYRLGNRDDLTNALLDQWLDSGLHDLAGRIKIRQLEDRDTGSSLTASSNTMAFPTNMIAIIDIYNATQSYPMTFIEKTRFLKLNIVSGSPRIWTTIGETVHFDKIATASDSLVVYGINEPVWGAADDQTPPIDTQLDYGLELLAAAHGFRDLGAATKAALIDNPNQPGTGQFWVWAQSNKIPTLIQGLASMDRSGAQVMGMEGYQVIQ